MKVLPVQPNKFNWRKVINKIKNIDVSKYKTNPECIKGSIGGFCAGGVAGYFFSIFSFLIGITMGFTGAICTFLVSSGLGAYLGNKLESKIIEKERKDK